MVSVSELIEKARSHVGVKYTHQGRTREKGVDCIGLFISCANELGIDIMDDTTYGLKVNPDHLLQGIEEHCERTGDIDVSPGNLLLMQFSKEAGATHVALCTETGMIHSYNKRKQVVEHRINHVWKSKIVATFRINGIDYDDITDGDQ